MSKKNSFFNLLISGFRNENSSYKNVEWWQDHTDDGSKTFFRALAWKCLGLFYSVKRVPINPQGNRIMMQTAAYIWQPGCLFYDSAYKTKK